MQNDTIFVTVLIPISTLRKLNEWLANHESQEGKFIWKEKNDQTVDLEILSIPQKPLLPRHGTRGVFVIKDRLFPMVPMILTRGVYSAWLETVFLFKASQENTLTL